MREANDFAAVDFATVIDRRYRQKMEFNAPVEIAAWLGCLAFGLMLFNEGAKLVDRVRGNPGAAAAGAGGPDENVESVQ
jgi:hypothetical protein